MESKPKESKPKFKYVMATYRFEHRSVWKVPADWDNTKIYVKWDRISYGNFDDDETAKMVKQKQGCDMFEPDFKRPDERTENPIEGCQRGLVFGNRQAIEDEGYYSCNDSGDEDESDDELEEECDPKMNEELESEPDDDQPDDGWKY